MYACAYIIALGTNIERIAEEYAICRVRKRKYNVQSETLGARCMSNRGVRRCACQEGTQSCVCAQMRHSQMHEMTWASGLASDLGCANEGV